MAFKQSVGKHELRTILAILGLGCLVISTFVVPMQLAQAAKTSASQQQQLLPNIKPVKETLADNDLVKDPTTGKTLLRFAGGIGNYGPGKIEVVGRGSASVDSSYNVLQAYQRVYNTDGTFVEVPVGQMNYHEAHHHYHFVNAVTYSLIDPSSNNKVVVSSAKQAFCLADVEVADPTVPNYPTAPVYNRCYNSPVATFVLMGVSPGWEDVYGKDLVGQSFDVTDLMNRPAHTYILEQTTNPDGVLRDSNGGTPQKTSIEVVLGQGVKVGVGTARPGV